MRLVAVGIPALLAGCASPLAPPANGGNATCVGDHLDRLIGGQRGARTERTALRLSGARIVRWVKPGEMVSMLFLPDRLTLTVDARGRIAAAHCG